MYDKCAAQYNYRYNMDLPWSTEVSPAANRGQTTHTHIEAFLKKDIDVLPPEINYYTQFLTGLRDHADYKLYPEKKIALDKDWNLVDWDGPNVWLKAILDLLIETPRELLVYDWKTGKEYDDHIKQRELYGIISLCAYPEAKEVRTMHVYLDSRQNRPTTFSRTLAIDTLLPVWNSRVSTMFSDRDFIPSPGWHCRYCPYSKTKGGPCIF